MPKFKRIGACCAAVLRRLLSPSGLLGTVVVLIAVNAILINIVSARYVTTSTDTEGARVAQFAPEIEYNEKWHQVSTFNSLNGTEDISLPFSITTENAEVKVKAVITVTHDGPLPLKYDLYAYNGTLGANECIAASIQSGVPIEIELPMQSVSRLELVVSWEGEHFEHLNGLTETMHLDVVCEQIQG